MAKKKASAKPCEVQLKDFASLEEAATAVGIGGLVVLCDCRVDDWAAHPKGAVVRINGQKDYDCQLRLNGQELLYEGQCRWWHYHPWGLEVRDWSGSHAHRFWLNGQLLYQGPQDDWCSHPQGVIVRLGSRFLLNGKLLYEGPYDEWQVHPRGVVIQFSDAKRGLQFLLNGTELLYEGWISDWFEHPRGVVLVDCGKRYLLDGRELLGAGVFYHEESVRPNPQGLIVRRGRRFLEYPAGRLLCQGACDEWKVHPHGVLLRRGRHLLLNGQQPPMYSNYPNYDGWEPHDLGAIVEETDRIVLAVGRPFDPFGPHPSLVVPEWIKEL
jgi:hypothetical protein